MKNYFLNKSIISSKRIYKFAVTIVMLFATVISFYNRPLIAHAAEPGISYFTTDISSGEIGDELTFIVGFKLVNAAKNVKLNIEIPKGLTLLEDYTEIIGLDSGLYYTDDTPLTTYPDGSQSYKINFVESMSAYNNDIFKCKCKVKINENTNACKPQKIECRMSFGHEESPTTSPPEEHSFYTFGFDLIMKTGTGEVLPGASFTLHRTGENNNINYYYTEPKDDNNICEPRFAALTQGTEAVSLITDSEGKISFSGLKSGSYTLTQTATAEGYDMLDTPIIITIGEDGKLSVTGIDVEPDNPNNVEDTENKIYINDNKPSASVYHGTLMLTNNAEQLTYIPAAGGIGVTAFYITGGILMFCAVVLFIINRRRLNGLK